MRLIMTASQIDADRDLWLKRRREGITASDIAGVLHLPGAWSSPTSIYYEKRDGRQRDDNDRMALGRFLEPYVLERFAQRYPGLYVGPGGLYAHDDRPYQMATFDAIAWERHGDSEPYLDAQALAPVQAKTSATYDGYGDDGSDQIPLPYLAQLLWEMDTGGFATGFLVVMFLPAGTTRVYEISRDTETDRDLDRMRAAAQAMLALIDAGTPPPPDGHPATGVALRHAHPDLEDREVVVPVRLARDYNTAKTQLDHWKDRAALAENRILARLGDARYAVTCDGQRVATRIVKPNRRVSIGLLRERHPQIAVECTITKPDPIVELRRPPRKEPQPCPQSVTSPPTSAAH